ncbi:MAG: peptidylprolyl isomerase [Myxococcota bacterium]
MLQSMMLMLALVSAPGDRELVDRIVAVVNDDVVIASELNAQAGPGVGDGQRKAMLEQLINERLMQQQIREAKININDDEVSRAIQDILRTNNISEAELQAAIDARNMSMSQYREDLKSQLIRLKLIDQKVRSRVVIPEAEIKAEFERQTRDEAKDEMVKIRHIFLRWGESPDPTERSRVMAKAQKARQQVMDGADFAETARAMSEGPTAATGGDLGEMSRQQMLPELARGIKGVKAGSLSAPIETDSGVHVVLVEARREKGSSAYAEARNAIYQKLYQREVEAQMKVWLEELRKQAAVSIML